MIRRQDNALDGGSYFIKSRLLGLLVFAGTQILDLQEEGRFSTESKYLSLFQNNRVKAHLEPHCHCLVAICCAVTLAGLRRQ